MFMKTASASPEMSLNFADLRKLSHSAPAELASLAGLSAAARTLSTAGEQEAGAFLARLVREGLWSDAIRFLAFALPRREGVWWACLSAHRWLGRVGPDADRTRLMACVEVAEAWVRRPCEETRRPAFAAAEAAAFETPAGYAALAAFWTGNLAGPDLPEIPPDPSLSPVAIAAAVLLGAVDADRGPCSRLYEIALAEALAIARGGDGRSMGEHQDAAASP
jgi:hypothetical protein